MSATVVLRKLHRLGVEVQAEGGRIRWRPKEAVGPGLLTELIANKDDLIALLSAPVVRCPSCNGPMDERRCCWRCCDRICSGCGRLTGSAFVASCVPCGNRPSTDVPAPPTPEATA